MSLNHFARLELEQTMKKKIITNNTLEPLYNLFKQCTANLSTNKRKKEVIKKEERNEQARAENSIEVAIFSNPKCSTHTSSVCLARIIAPYALDNVLVVRVRRAMRSTLYQICMACRLPLPFWL